jgi:Holliday junction DNA helicase RuvA
VPAADVPFLSAGIDQTVTFYTLMYFEGDAGGGSMEPRLLGFLRPEDKRFFEKFITVKGIGPKKALKAFIFPASDIAAAIENKDARFLVQLPAIGKRMAEQIVAELSGKVQEFVLAGVERRSGPAPRGGKHTPLEEDAIQALMALGERRETAESLLERAKSGNESFKTAESLIREMFRLRAVRA